MSRTAQIVCYGKYLFSGDPHDEYKDCYQTADVDPIPNLPELSGQPTRQLKHDVNHEQGVVVIACPLPQSCCGFDQNFWHSANTQTDSAIKANDCSLGCPRVASQSAHDHGVSSALNGQRTLSAFLSTRTWKVGVPGP